MFTKIINVIIFAVLFSTVSIAGHASAMPTGMHGSMEHGSSSADCATVCLSAPTDSKRQSPEYDEQENEPEPPFYLQFESTRTGWFAEKSIPSRDIEQEGKVPIYQWCCVLRV